MAEGLGLQKQWLVCITVGLLILLLYWKVQLRWASSELQSSTNEKTQNVDVMRAFNPEEPFLYPDKEPGIMFVETSNSLKPSELTVCAIESAARTNPGKHVYYFMKGFNGNLSALKESSQKGIQLLFSFHNVTLLPLNLEELFTKTPLLDWYKKTDPEKEKYWVHVLSDACRIALLWKYGGIYLDTDVISLKPLEFINFTCEQSDNYANGAALGFSRNHSFIRDCMIDYVENYDGDRWGWQGPDLITRMLKKWCRSEKLNDFLNQKCQDVTFFPKDWFYPISYMNWKVYFQNDTWKKNSSVEDNFANSRGVHIWNFLSGRQSNPIKETRSYMEYFFKNYCPTTYGALEQ
ncbi:lactosylceramide 4-alpha-galactosyltransferase-like [Pristis pectinata]|uniref:lactosylceramide 4-alpha-galactosyltransferase-like n=1 Tax=Pristis pectinata TaxID=685728 RepID=UPI00223D0B5D|nr:lactosylceramide 4-alpha-galactosyltransferase-like [Pristis pectinata]XP_051874903.1 lactosylceramide 4-alpha-galactosyltransferase-like [Pristis pectinata]XP_051874904.1 lactosylceramide 4-alpha-galactosyltransferase-like [Pristis pectinata]